MTVSLDEDAFRDLVESSYADLFRYAARRVGTDAAADVVADVFLVAWRRREVLPVDAPRLWLFGIASRIVANHVRSVHRRERLHLRLATEVAAEDRRATPAPSTPERSDAPDAADSDDAELVRAALGRLREAEQEALRLTEWEQLSVEEAAAVAGVSRGTFRVRLHRARRHLAEELASPSSPAPTPLRKEAP